MWVERDLTDIGQEPGSQHQDDRNERTGQKKLHILRARGFHKDPTDPLKSKQDFKCDQRTYHPRRVP